MILSQTLPSMKTQNGDERPNPSCQTELVLKPLDKYKVHAQNQTFYGIFLETILQRGQVFLKFRKLNNTRFVEVLLPATGIYAKPITEIPMKLSLKDLQQHVTPRTPVKILVPSAWLNTINEPGWIWVEVCYLEFCQPQSTPMDNQTMEFNTTNHGRSKVDIIPATTLVELDYMHRDLVAQYLTKPKTTQIRGISID